MASPDQSRWPPRYRSAARTPQPHAAPICAAVLIGQSVRAMSESTEPANWPASRSNGRPVSMVPDRGTDDAVPMTTQPPNATNEISIELAALVRNVRELFRSHAVENSVACAAPTVVELWPYRVCGVRYGNAGICGRNAGCRYTRAAQLPGDGHRDRGERRRCPHTGGGRSFWSGDMESHLHYPGSVAAQGLPAIREGDDPRDEAGRSDGRANLSSLTTSRRSPEKPGEIGPEVRGRDSRFARYLRQLVLVDSANTRFPPDNGQAIHAKQGGKSGL